MYGELWRKNTPFLVLFAKVSNSTPTNYIFLRSAIITLSVEHIKSWNFQNFNFGLECLLIVSILYMSLIEKAFIRRIKKPVPNPTLTLTLTLVLCVKHNEVFHCLYEVFGEIEAS